MVRQVRNVEVVNILSDRVWEVRWWSSSIFVSPVSKIVCHGNLGWGFWVQSEDVTKESLPCIVDLDADGSTVAPRVELLCRDPFFLFYSQ